MDEETREAFAALNARIDGLTPATPEPTEAPDRAEVIEAALEEGLSKTARARVLKAVEAGESPEDAIKAEKALKDEILAEAKVTDEDNGTGGRYIEGAGEKRDLSDLFPSKNNKR